MIRILDYLWHQAHSYRLHAIPAEFTYLNVRQDVWNVSQRPIPSNWRGIIEPDEVRRGQFDVAFLHLDQWCTDMLNLRAAPFRIARRVAERNGIPCIVIMHGTPDSADNRRKILRLIGDLPVVCNSKQAAQEWDGGGGEGRRVDRHGLPQFRSIIHGYDVEEFWTQSFDQRDREHVVSICSGGEISAWYHGVPMLHRLRFDVPLWFYGPTGNKEWLDDYTSYRLMLSKVLIYFSSTQHAPMPGARTEAMLSGACIVSVPGNDWENYIEHGKTGFIVESYVDAVETLRMLLRDPKMAYNVGKAGRKVARAAFNKGRFVRDWLALLVKLGINDTGD